MEYLVKSFLEEVFLAAGKGSCFQVLFQTENGKGHHHHYDGQHLQCQPSKIGNVHHQASKVEGFASSSMLDPETKSLLESLEKYFLRSMMMFLLYTKLAHVQLAHVPAAKWTMVYTLL